MVSVKQVSKHSVPKIARPWIQVSLLIRTVGLDKALLSIFTSVGSQSEYDQYR